MFDILLFMWIMIQLVIGYNLVIPLLLSLIFYFRSKKCLEQVSTTQPDYAIIVTAYQYINTLPDTVASILKLSNKNFIVYVVADNCDTSSLQLEGEQVVLLEPEEVLRGNIKSHFYAIERFKREHTHLTIIDSDNLVHPEYLDELNKYFSLGFEAVQGMRDAKNLDTTYACLDAARDIYYHHYDCEILFNCGSSSTLSGSGMAFTTALYKECLQNERINGAGFDKILQARIVEKDKRIAFAPSAIVYDEKTSHTSELVNQRSRWINTWFKYFGLGFILSLKGIKNRSWNQFLFGLILLRPPLFVFLILSLLMLLMNIFINPTISLIWLAGVVVFTGSFLKALLMSDTDTRIYRSLIGIPKFIFYQLISLSKIRRANVRSVSTRHYHT